MPDPKRRMTDGWWGPSSLPRSNAARTIEHRYLSVNLSV